VKKIAPKECEQVNQICS